ncbi:MAG: hypothetical protein WCG98_07465 [bacterium]
MKTVKKILLIFLKFWAVVFAITAGILAFGGTVFASSENPDVLPHILVCLGGILLSGALFMVVCWAIEKMKKRLRAV